ncbi:MAG: endonuclease/exonuclease/phosphatase family protein [Pseudomonadota bacterium]
MKHTVYIVLLYAASGCTYHGDGGDGDVLQDADIAADHEADATNEEAGEAPDVPEEFDPFTITVATYNLHMFETGSPSIKYNALAAVFEQMDADIVALQELSEPEALVALLGYLGDHTSLGYVDQAAGSGDYVQNGVISRFDLVDEDTELYDPYITDPFGEYSGTFSRKLLKVRVQVAPACSFILLVTHLKAMDDAASFARRRAEAYKIEEIMRDHVMGFEDEIILAGDMNNVVEGSGGDWETTLVYLALESDGDPANDFYNPALEELSPLPSTVHRYEVYLDHFFISPAMRLRYVEDSVEVIDYGPAESDDASDHYPVVTTYEISPPG